MTVRLRQVALSMTRVVLGVVFLAALISAVAGALWLQDLGVFRIDPSLVKTVTEYRHKDNTIIFDRNGEKIGEVFSSYHIFVPYSDIPRDLIRAIVAIEDRGFFNHAGYDPRGILRATWHHFTDEAFEQGASTITQQVVRRFLLTREKSYTRKVREIALAIELEKRTSKQRIFEVYANSSFLGNGSNGVAAAAMRYFGKPLSELRLHEHALIAGLFQSPSRFNPAKFPARARKRQLVVLRAMRNVGFLTAQAEEQWAKIPLVYKSYAPIRSQVAPWFVDYVESEAARLLDAEHRDLRNGGLRIHTTLDVRVQREAAAAMIESDDVFSKAERSAALVRQPNGALGQPRVEGAVLVTDPIRGEIVAMLGGRDYSQSQFNRATSALRSPGSAFKPVAYSLALQSRWRWSDMIYVAPVAVGTYRPRSAREDFFTEATLLRAFYRSMNAPSVELAVKLGVPRLMDHAKNLGVRTPLKDEAGIVLGSSEVTMLDLARMYGTFAAQGRRTDLVAISRIEDRDGRILFAAPDPLARSENVMTPQVAYLMTEGLRSVLQYGTATSIKSMASFAVGKTGTSNDAADTWFCGYTPTLAVMAWVGTDGNTALTGLSAGNTLALPLWERVVKRSLPLYPPGTFQRPPGVVTVRVNPSFGNRSATGIDMVFLNGLEPQQGPSSLEAVSGQKGFREIFGH